MGRVCVGEMCMGHESWKCVGIIGIVNNGFQLLQRIRFGWWGDGVWGVGWLTTKGMSRPSPWIPRISLEGYLLVGKFWT